MSGDRRTSTFSWLLPGPLRRLREHLRETRRVAGETQAQLAGTGAALGGQLAELSDVISRIEALAADEARALARIDARLKFGESAAQALARGVEAPAASTRTGRKDLLLGCFTGLDWGVVQYWANSLHLSGFSGDRVVLVDNVDGQTLDRLRALDFAVHPLNPDQLSRGYAYAFSSEQNFGHRFQAFFEYLDGLPNLDDYRYVITTDVRDVVFQSDPSRWLEAHLGAKQICASAESLRYENEPWGENSLRRAYPKLYRRMASRPIWNCGVQAGDARLMRDFWLQLSLSIAAGLEAADQAAYNILLSLWPWSDVTYFARSEEGWACQAGTTANPDVIDQFRPHLLEPTPTWDGTRACTSRGEPHVILHQFNRVPEWLAAVQRTYANASHPSRDARSAGLRL
jgi:hypothetical protein